MRYQKNSIWRNVSYRGHSYFNDILRQVNPSQCSDSQSIAVWGYMFPKSRMEETSVWKKNQNKPNNPTKYTPLPQNTHSPSGPLIQEFLTRLNGQCYLILPYPNGRDKMLQNLRIYLLGCFGVFFFWFVVSYFFNCFVF